MFSDTPLRTTDVLGLFSEEVAAHGGRINDVFHTGQRLFVRCVFPRTEEVRPRDKMQGGIALKATDYDVFVYPYVFRQVCQNGAIMATTLASRPVRRIQKLEPESALEAIREEIIACCAPEVFSDTMRPMRTACEIQADVALSLIPLLSLFEDQTNNQMVAKIMEQFFQDADTSQFGLANAVTAVARDVDDPDLRWNLEEFGGGIAICQSPPNPMDDGYAERESFDWCLLVGRSSRVHLDRSQAKMRPAPFVAREDHSHSGSSFPGTQVIGL